MTTFLSERSWAPLQQLLDALPRPCDPLDVVMLDGYLCAVLLRPRALPPAQWLPPLLGLPARAALPRLPDELRTLLVQRRDELDQSIARRQWFDPCVYELDDASSASEPVAPWVAGFDIGLQAFALSADEAELTEPLALLYRHLGDDALEDGQGALQDEIDSLEPPTTLAEAVEELVRAVLLIADVTRPR